MILHILGSSSSGNCYLFQSEQTGDVLVVEAGVNFREVQRAVDFDISHIVACIISHEHGDHAAYATKFTDRCIPVIGSIGTITALEKQFGASPMFRHCIQGMPVDIRGFRIVPFHVEHDAAEPFGFIIQHQECGAVLFATDTYYLKQNFVGLNHILLECNYNKEILDDNLRCGKIGLRRYNRTLQSHMSSTNCLRTLYATDLSMVSKVVLLHLSDANSDAQRCVADVRRQHPSLDVFAATSGQKIDLNKYPY